jgi:hypothetical protein
MSTPRSCGGIGRWRGARGECDRGTDLRRVDGITAIAVSPLSLFVLELAPRWTLWSVSPRRPSFMAVQSSSRESSPVASLCCCKLAAA